MATTNFMERFKDKISTMGRFGELELDSNRAVSKASSCLQTKSNLKLVANSILNFQHIEDAKFNLPEENPSQFVRPIKLAGKLSEDGVYSSELNTNLRTIKENPRLINLDGLYNQMDKYNYQSSYNSPARPSNYQPQSLYLSPQSGPSIKPRTVSPPIRQILSSPLVSKPFTTDKPSSQASPQNADKHKRVEYKPYTLQDYENLKFGNYYELGGLGPSSVGTEDWRRKKELQDRRRQYANRVKLTNSSVLSSSPTRSNERKSEEIPSARQKALEFAKKIPRPRLKVKIEDSKIERAQSDIHDLIRMEMEHERLKASVVYVKKYLE